MRWFRLRRCVIALVAVSFLLCMLLGIHVITRMDGEDDNSNDMPMWLDPKIQQDQKRFGLGGSQLLQNIKPRAGSDAVENLLQEHQNIDILKDSNKLREKMQLPDFDNNQFENRVEKGVESKNIEQNAANIQQRDDLDQYPEPNYNVHIFYYMWYGNPKMDKEYIHWNHKRLPHWDKKVAKKYSTDQHIPPDDIGSNFYPELGPYSSRDPKVIDNHMEQIRSTGAGVLAISWYPPGLSDDNGTPWDHFVPDVMDAAHRYQLKVCFHIEPFAGRTANTIMQWIGYIVDTYGSHPAFYRFTWQGKELPLYYMYDSYQVSAEEWQKLLTKDGSESIRNTPYDGYFIGLLVEQKHQDSLHRSEFDGYYTYFASDGFSYGSSTQYWRTIAKKAQAYNEIFIPSVGPGYVDDRVRPWNNQNTKERDRGRYYDAEFGAAIGSSAPVISVTSFNEWHEGTQIEKAVPKTMVGYKYLNYEPHSSDFYLQLTKKWVDKFRENKRS